VSRRIAAQIAANTRWAREKDRTAATEKAREAFFERFIREVDPDGLLPSDERQKRANNALRAHMARLRSSSRSRQTKAVTRNGGDDE